MPPAYGVSSATIRNGSVNGSADRWAWREGNSGGVVGLSGLKPLTTRALLPACFAALHHRRLRLPSQERLRRRVRLVRRAIIWISTPATGHTPRPPLSAESDESARTSTGRGPTCSTGDEDTSEASTAGAS
jgi:hypothetical protein